MKYASWTLILVFHLVLVRLSFADVKKEQTSDDKVLTIKPRLSLHLKDGPVHCLAFSRDAKIIAAGAEQRVHLFDSQTGKLLKKLEGHTNDVVGLAFSQNGDLLASCAKDDTAIRLWDTQTGTTSRILAGDPKNVISVKGHPYPVTGLAFSPTGPLLATCCRDHVFLWDTKAGHWDYKVRSPSRPPVQLAFTANARLLAVTQATGNVLVFELIPLNSKQPSGPSLREKWDLKVSEPRAQICTCFSPNSQKLLTTVNGKMVRIWDISSGKPVLKLDAPKFTKSCYTDFSPDGTAVLSVTPNDSIEIWDVNSGELRVTIVAKGIGSGPIAMSHHGRMLASAAGDGFVRLWELTLHAEKHDKKQP